MHTTTVQLPNGDFLEIAGANAHRVASIINEHLVRNVPMVPGPNTNAESPLEIPVLNFSKAPVSANAEGDDSVLEMPKLF